jgi:hypothetical protein
MCENWQSGIKNDRTANDWKKYKITQPNIDVYEGALMRHLHGAKKTSGKERQKHLAAIACNANILWSMECQK